VAHPVHELGGTPEGSVRRVGQRLRIAAQLISVRDGFHLWSESYDVEGTAVLATVSGHRLGAATFSVGRQRAVARLSYTTATLHPLHCFRGNNEVHLCDWFRGLVVGSCGLR
jgi:hypothetical protein